MTNRTTIAAAEAVARGQYGVFSVRQAQACGVTRSQLDSQSGADGRWRRVVRGVYEVRAFSPDWRRPLMTALLWAGPNAVLSHRSAAAVLDLDGVRRGIVELWLPRTGKGHDQWILHRGRPPSHSIITQGPLRLTDARRTFADLAPVVDGDSLEMTLESILRKRQATFGELEAAIGSTRGAARARAVLSRRSPEVPPTGSELETRFIQLVRPLGLPELVRQHPVTRSDRVIAYLDLAWPDLALFIELDGRLGHADPVGLFRDGHRQNEVVTTLGWRPLRYTWRDVVGHPVDTGRKVVAAYRAAASGAWDDAHHRSTPLGVGPARARQ